MISVCEIILMGRETKNNSHGAVLFINRFGCLYFILMPPVYEVYRGYIVFVFSVIMFVCLCINFFFVKDFSGTTEPRILKFGTTVGYILYCVRENQPPPAYHSH